MKSAFKHLQMCGLKLNKYSRVIFTHVEVVGRGGEKQLQVGENLNHLIFRVNYL